MRRRDPGGLAEDLRALCDELRGGASLRQALERSADASTLGFLREPLASGRALPEVLREAAAQAREPALAEALLVLAIQAGAGGDPIPAVAAVEARLRRRLLQEREARALTAQARMSARTVLAIGPGFLALLVLLDPGAMWRVLSRPEGRVLLALGLLLQAAGAVWVARIVRNATRDRSGGRAPEVAEGAETLAALLEAGLSTARSLEVLASVGSGGLGESLRRVRDRIRAGAGATEAVASVLGSDDDPSTVRLARVLEGARLGVPLAAPLRALAAEIREIEVSRTAEAVREASVRVLLPLGLLILPAFVLTCLVPLLLGGLEGITS